MKKVMFPVLFLLILFALIPGSLAAAETTTYYLDELEMSIDIPADLIVFTRDTAPDDPNLVLYDIDWETLLGHYKSNDIYLNVVSENLSYEIIITMQPGVEYGEWYDLSEYSDDELFEISSELIASYADVGVIVKDWEPYNHLQAKFLKVHAEMNDENGMLYLLQYNTLINKKFISINLRSYDEDIILDMDGALTMMVDSISFTGQELAAQVAASDQEDNSDYSLAEGMKEEMLFPADASNGMLAGAIIFDLLITILICTAPVIIYRYVIRKEPLPHKKALVLTIIFGVIAMIIFLFIAFLLYTLYGDIGDYKISGAIFLWSFVNYAILTRGKSRKMPDPYHQTEPGEERAPDDGADGGRP